MAGSRYATKDDCGRTIVNVGLNIKEKVDWQAGRIMFGNGGKEGVDEGGGPRGLNKIKYFLK